MAKKPMIKSVKSQSGISIIAIVLTLLIFAIFISVAISLVTTGSHIGVQEEQGTQAFYIAEGGVEFEQRSLAQNLDWYKSVSDPISTTTKNLGSGSFTVSSNLPATMLRTRIPTAASIAPIRVYTTNRFPSSDFLQIDDDITGSAEFIQYTGIAGDTFTGITRNITIGGITGASGAGPHERGARVYPVTTLGSPFANNCANIPSPFQIVANSKFLTAGTITVQHNNAGTIEYEEISYTGSSISGANMTLTGVQRCQNVTGPVTGAVGDPVTPILWDGISPDFESEIISTGTVGSNPLSGNIVRVIRKTVQR